MKTLFHFATRELTHSAFWAWILNSTDPGTRSDPSPTRLGHALLERIGAASPSRTIEVTKEYALPHAGGRVDIHAEIDGRDVVLIENKVSALPDQSQLLRYSNRLMGPNRIHKAIISTAFDVEQRGWLRRMTEWTYLGIEDITRLVAPYRTDHPIVGEYFAWIDGVRTERSALFQMALSNEPWTHGSGTTPEAQWKLMLELTSGFHGHQYRGVNIGGGAWTQFSFVEEQNGLDAIFYRIDDSSQGPYLSVRQWQRTPTPSLREKLERLERLRQMWAAAAESVNSPIRWKPPRGRGKKECEIAWCLLTENSPALLVEALSPIHHRFVDDLSRNDWKLETV
jgi:hypothetical protein